MDDLISRNKLLEGIDDLIAGIAFTSPYQDELHSLIDGMERVRDRVAEAPTLTLDDLRPKGRWERDENGKVYCGVCKKKALEVKKGVWHIPNFCNHCGADMRGGGEDA